MQVQKLRPHSTNPPLQDGRIRSNENHARYECEKRKERRPPMGVGAELFRRAPPAADHGLRDRRDPV